MYNVPRLAQRPSALALDVHTRRAEWQQGDDGGAAAPGHVAPRGVSYRQRWRRNKKLLVACVAAALLLPLLQLAAAWRAGRGGGATAAAAGAGAPPLTPWKGLPRYVSVLPRRQPEPEPGCLGWRLGGGHATSSEDDADLEAGPSTPLKRKDCYLPLEREPGTRGTCICSGTRVDVNLEAMRAARGRRKTAPPLLCATLCRKVWEEDACPALNAAKPEAVPLRAQMPQLGALYPLWTAYERAFRLAGGLQVVRPPGKRGFGGLPEVDWVARGEEMEQEDVATARKQWRRFVAEAPEYPEKLFTGRGIVTTGGGLKYMVPVWVSINMLRRAGCMLPIEVWFFENEMPAADAAAALRQRGVLVRSVDEIRVDASRDIFRGGTSGFGFVMKAAVIAFSSFQEVLYLDSDNVALLDPTDLFDFAGYRETGMVVWPDYWKPTVAPDMYRIAPEATPPNGTVESGQIVINKRKCWKALLLALFLNCQGSLYFNLLTNYMGVGDKETFAFAMRMLQMPYHAVGDDYPVTSAGLRGEPRTPGGAPTLSSTCMVQYHPADGRMLLFHSNLNKWTLSAPTAWTAYTRRWVVLSPPGWRFVEHPGEVPPLTSFHVALNGVLGYDAERVCWAILRALRCAPWFESYVRAHAAAAADVERVFELAPRDHSYNSFILDDHVTGVYIDADASPPPPPLPALDDGIDDGGGAQLQPRPLKAGSPFHDEERLDDWVAATHRRRTPPPRAAPLSKRAQLELEAAFARGEGHVLPVTDMERLARATGLDLVTLYVWWNDWSKGRGPPHGTAG